MGLIKKDFKRKSGIREAKLIVIACEGSETEPRYFQALRTHFQKSGLRVEILDRKDWGIDKTKSAAKYVIECLNGFKRTYHLDKHDELWLLLDRDKDNFSEAQLSKIAQLCVQKKYHLAVSNPTFELWLLFHFENIALYETDKQQVLLENPKISNEKRLLEKELEKHLEGYHKARFNTLPLIEKVENAVEHAAFFPLPQNERWHQGLGTRVYELVKSIII